MTHVLASQHVYCSPFYIADNNRYVSPKRAPADGIAHQVSLTVEKFPYVESLHDIASQVKHKFHKVETAALFRCLCLGKTLISNWYVLYPEGGC